MDHIELQGKIISLIPLTEEHLPQLFEASKPLEIWEWSATKILNWEDAVSFVKNGIDSRDKGKQYPFVVIHNQTKAIIGSTSFRNIQFDHLTVEIGSTWYHPSYWRTAVNTECKYLLLQYAFEKWGMNRVEFRTDERNTRSQNAISRLGAKEEGVFRKERILKDGIVRNTVVFSILQEEWPSVKNQLEKTMVR